MSTEEQNKELDKVLTALKEGLSKPKGWGVMTNAPYYRKHYAEWLKPILDKLLQQIETNQHLPVKRLGLQVGPAVSRINQAWRYIIDYLDTPDKTYARLRLCIQVRKRKDDVIFCWRNNPNEIEPDSVAADLLQPLLDEVESEATSRPRNTNWMKAIEDFLEAPYKEGAKLVLHHIRLKPQDQQLIVEMCLSIGDAAITKITEYCLHIVRSEKLAAMWKEELATS